MLFRFHSYYCLLAALLLSVGISSCDTATQKETTTVPQVAPPDPTVYVIAGDYHDIILGVDGEQITGFYQSKEAPTCSFFFEGKVGNNNPLSMQCYNPATTVPPIHGEFKIMGEEMFVKLHHAPDSSCIADLSDKIGHVALLDLSHNWKAIRIIEKEAPIFEADVQGIEKGQRLQRGTTVAVKEYKKEWVRVDVPSLGYVDGWVHRSMFFPLLDL